VGEWTFPDSFRELVVLVTLKWGAWACNRCVYIRSESMVIHKRLKPPPGSDSLHSGICFIAVLCGALCVPIMGQFKVPYFTLSVITHVHYNKSLLLLCFVGFWHCYWRITSLFYGQSSSSFITRR